MATAGNLSLAESALKGTGKEDPKPLGDNNGMLCLIGMQNTLKHKNDFKNSYKGSLQHANKKIFSKIFGHLGKQP